MPAIALGMSAYILPRHRRGLTVPLLRHEDGAEDAHGNAVDSWAEVALLKGCAFDPGSTSEPRLAGQERVIVEPTLYAAYDAPVEPLDRLVVRDETYEVEGVARRWESPFSGRQEGCVITLRKVDG
jgi:hypothetical protein